MSPHFGNGDLAVDLGTANTLVYERGRGIVVSEPSVIAVDRDSGEVYAVGEDAHRMIGRTPATISATRPLRHGVIADFEVTEQMLRHFLRKAHRSRWARHRVVMCVPSGVTDVEARAVEEACLSAGARQVALIEEPIAAAIGAGLAIEEPAGRMVLDIGGGTSEVAVVSLGEIVVEASLRLGGYDMDEAVIAHVRREHNLAIGQPTAEGVKMAIGSALRVDEPLEIEVRGRELVSGLPRTVTLDGDEIRAALAEPIQSIVDAVKDTLERTPPELASDILTNGILLAGGGCLLRGLADRLHAETHMPTYLAESALTCVAVGAGQSLEEFEVLVRRQKPRGGHAGRSRSRSRRRESRVGF
jgi:rod shape-determining protein MreB